MPNIYEYLFNINKSRIQIINSNKLVKLFWMHWLIVGGRFFSKAYFSLKLIFLAIIENGTPRAPFVLTDLELVSNREIHRFAIGQAQTHRHCIVKSWQLHNRNSKIYLFSREFPDVAARGSLHCDFIGQKFICYLLKKTAKKYREILTVKKSSSIPARDAICISVSECKCQFSLFYALKFFFIVSVLSLNVNFDFVYICSHWN